MNNKETQLSYDEAYASLRDILQKIESGSISIDEVSQEVKKANELIIYCREKLRTIETDLEKYFETEN